MKKQEDNIKSKNKFFYFSSNSMKFTDEEAEILEKEFIEAYSGSTKNKFKILFNLYKKYPWQLLISIICHAIATLPHLITPVITANLINLAIRAYNNEPGDHFRGIIFNVIALALLVLINIPTNYWRVKYRSIALRKVEMGLRGALVMKLQQLSIPFHKAMQSGRIQSKLLVDVDAVRGLSVQLFTSLPSILINTIAALVVVVNRNLTVFAFFIMCIPCAAAVMSAFTNKIMESYKVHREKIEKTSASLVDMLEMTQITRAHAVEDKEVSKMTHLLNSTAETGVKLDIIHEMLGTYSWVIFQGFQIACLVFSVYLAMKGQIEIGDISLYQAYFGTLTGQVASIMGLIPIISKGFDSVSSVGEILSSEDIEDNRGKKKINEFKGEYEFKNVSFSYEDEQELLKGLDLKVKAGETIAIVGESGSGKTTILNLVLGFNTPNGGKLYIDGNDITEIDLHSYRENLAVVPQNCVMFTGSIRDNITYGLDDVSDEKIKTILDASLLTEFVNILPNGLDSHIDEHAANVSGGQRQRLAIARALMRDPKVIIFDEATSALDSVSEKHIQEAINNLSKDRTTFIVAHRLSTIKDADRIAVIKDGACCEIGTFDELMAKQGEFYRMQTVQQI